MSSEEGQEGKANWRKLKQHVAVASKINNRISSANFIGEDLKFSDDSLEGCVAATLQLGISQIVSSSSKTHQEKSTEKRSSALFRSPIGGTSMELDSVQLESINEPLDDRHHGYTFNVNGETCEFIEYYPEIFAMVRHSLDIDLIEYKAVLGTNIRTEFTKLSAEEVSTSTSSLNSLSQLDKKLNASLKGAKDRTESVFKSLSKKQSAEPPEEPTAPESSPPLNDENQQEANLKNSKLRSAISGVSSKFKTVIDQAKQSVQRKGSQDETTSSPPEEILRSASTDSCPSTIRSSLRFIGTKDASGKSSSWFLFSPDMRYCCKTTKPTEAELLMKILPSYAMHCESNPDTILPHFFGLYRIQVMGHIYWFIIQGNVFASPKPISERYDVKGSTHGRSASDKEKSKGVHTIYKDLDLIQNERFLCFEKQSDKDELIQILSRDVHWLESHALMDYSFLLGFVDYNDETSPSSSNSPATGSSRDRFAIKSLHLVDERFSSVYVGLIDILTEYMLKKKVETFMTGTLLLQSGISCQPPQKYAQRLIEFIERITIVLPQEEGAEGGSGGIDSDKLKIIRDERKRELEESLEKNVSQPMEWIKETTNEMKELTEKAHLTIQSEIEKIREIIEKKNEGPTIASASPTTAAATTTAVDSATDDR